MPLFYTHNINREARLAVWHIAEDEEFFKRITLPQHQISHPHKRLQHLAGRYLLKILEPDFPVNEILLDGRRPYLIDNSYYFSISHAGDYAAAMVSQSRPVGIDVEVITKKLELLEKKYLNPAEQEIVRAANTPFSLTEKLASCWSAKESMFKWYALGNVDFRKDMIIESYEAHESSGTIHAVFGKEVQKELQIDFQFFEELCLAWVM